MLPPFFPEVIRLLRFAIAEPVVQFDVYRIGPPGMVNTPANQLVKPTRHIFIKRTNTDAHGTGLAHTPPIHATRLGINRPLKLPGDVGYVIRL